MPRPSRWPWQGSETKSEKPEGHHHNDRRREPRGRPRLGGPPRRRSRERSYTLLGIGSPGGSHCAPISTTAAVSASGTVGTPRGSGDNLKNRRGGVATDCGERRRPVFQSQPTKAPSPAWPRKSSPFQDQSLQSEFSQRRVERFQLFLLAGALCLALAELTTDRLFLSRRARRQAPSEGA